MSDPQTLAEQLVSATLQPEVVVVRRDLLAAVLDRLDVLEAVADAAQAYVDMDDRPSDDQPDDWEYTLGKYLRSALGAAHCVIPADEVDG